MEEYIAAAIVILLIIGFVPQNVIQQNNHTTIMEAETIVEEAKEKAAQEGKFTDEIIATMKSELADLGFEESEILTDDPDTSTVTTTTIKYRTENFSSSNLIYYEIGIPIKKVLVNNKFYGVSDADNQYTYWFKGSIASEKILIGGSSGGSIVPPVVNPYSEGASK